MSQTLLIHISANFVEKGKGGGLNTSNVIFQMKKAEWIPVLFVSVVLVVYLVMEFLNLSPAITHFTFSLSPLLIVWLVFSIIRYGDKNVRELKSDEEWGYADME